jgi:hypothetical protein
MMLLPQSADTPLVAASAAPPQARAGMAVDDPLRHNVNQPGAHHHLQHDQHHSAGQEHKP